MVMVSALPPPHITIDSNLDGEKDQVIFLTIWPGLVPNYVRVLCSLILTKVLHCRQGNFLGYIKFDQVKYKTTNQFQFRKE